MILVGKITKIEEDTIWTEITDLGVDQQMPCRWVISDLSVGDTVLVVNVDGAQEDLIVIGKIKGEASD